MSFYPWISFSDTAKYIEAAKNLSLGHGLVTHHSFFSPDLLTLNTISSGFPATFSPLVSWFYSIIFRFLPISDLTVIITGYALFLLVGILIFLIGKKIYSREIGLIATIFLFSSLYFWDYAHNSTTEIFFTLELLIFTYLLLDPRVKSISTPISCVLVALMYFTRQQTPLVVLAVLLTLAMPIWEKSNKKQRLMLLVLLIVGAVGTYLFAKNTINGALLISNKINPSNYIRGDAYNVATKESFVSKVFYNLYNFAKLPDRLTSPVILFLYIIYLLIPSSNLQQSRFKYFSLFNFILFTFATSATLANARYVHPSLSLVFVGSAIAIKKIFATLKILPLYLYLSIVFIILPAIGYFTLDSRFRDRQLNPNKPPVYKLISTQMASAIPKNKLIVTNLDAWASWYDGLTTVWFPLRQEMLQEIADKVDYIVITNYLENDRDFALGDWADIVYQPENVSQSRLGKTFRLLKTFSIDPVDNYQNLAIKGVILVKK